MDNQTQPNVLPFQPQKQTPILPTTNWAKILFFIIFGLIIIVASFFAGFQIGKKQTVIVNPPTINKVLYPSFTPTPTSPIHVGNAIIPPIPTISQISVCNSLPSALFSSPNTEAKQLCQVIELRTRDLLLATYNLHHLLREIQNGQIQQVGMNRINDLNGNLTSIWLNLASYGLGTDPYVDIHIFFSGSAFSDAPLSPSFGLPTQYRLVGMPRLYNQYLEKSSLSLTEITARQTKFLQLVQPYSNPSVFPFKNFYERAYFSYRNNQLLESAQYQEDLKVLDTWLTDLEKALMKIPSFLSS